MPVSSCSASTIIRRRGREPKGIVTAEQFRQFCSEVVRLARLTQRTFTQSDRLSAVIDVAHAGAADLTGAAFRWTLTSESGKEIAADALPRMDVPRGGLTGVGTITASLSSVSAPTKARLEVYLPGTQITNAWDIWVYPDPDFSRQRDGLFRRAWNESLAREIAAGATVILELTGEQIPHATRQLRQSLLDYACSDAFRPRVTINAADVDRLIAVHQQERRRETQ